MHIHFPILLLNYVAEVFIPNSEALSRNKKMFVPVSKFGYIRFPFQFAFVFKLGPMQIMFTLAPANLKYKYNSLCVTDEIGQAALNIHLEINIHLSNSKLCPLFSTPDHKKQFVEL